MEGERRGLLVYLLIIIFSFLFFRFVKAESILDVPFISQFPPGTSWYETKNCGPTSYLMINSFYTTKALSVQSIKDVDDWLSINYGRPLDNYNGYYTTIDDLKNLGTEFGSFLGDDITFSDSLEKVRSVLKGGNPVIVFVYTNMFALGKGIDQPHFMVLTGISGDTVYVNDPGKTEGKNKAYPLQQFLYAWSLQNNVALIFYPPGHTQISETKSGGLFSGLFNFVNNIFDWQNIIPTSQDVKGETEVAPVPEDKNVVYGASIIDKNQTLEVVPGQIVDIVVKAKNTGNITWQKKLVSLNVLDSINSQKFYDSSWLTHLRPALVDSDVTAGETGTFSFKIKAPEAIGNYNFGVTIVRQEGSQFSAIGEDTFVLSLVVKKAEDVVGPVVIDENKNSKVLDNIKQTVDDVVNKINDVVKNIVGNIFTFFGGGSSGSNSANTESNNNEVLGTFESELFFTVSSSISLVNSPTTTIFGDRSSELVNLEINNVVNNISATDTSWSADINLIEGENNLLLVFSNSDKSRTITGTLQIILDSVVPDKPSFSAVLNTDSDPYLDLTWQSTDQGSGIDYYILEYRLEKETEWQSILENTTSTELLWPVVVGNSYLFRVMAVDKAGNESVWSNENEDNFIVVDWSKEVVINEISYAPTYEGSCGSEWIELYNPTGGELDLSGWTLEVSGANFSSATALSGFVSSTAYKVFGVPNIPDTGAKIILKNSLGKIIDETNQSSGWFPDLNFGHVRSLERIDSNISGNTKTNWRENNSLRFQLYSSSCGQNYSSQGYDNNSYYYLSNKLSEDYIFSSTSSDSHVLILTKDHNPYILDARVVLPVNYTLVIEPGVVLVGNYGQSYLEVGGNVQINGTKEEPVYFTSARDKTVADWYLTGTPSTLPAGEPSPGDWSVIIIKGGGSLQAEYANFLYGGFTYRNGDCFVCYAQQVIRNEGGVLVLNHSSFDNVLLKKDYADGNDAYIWGGNNIEVNNSNFNNGYTAIMTNGGTHISLTNNTFSNFVTSTQGPLLLSNAILDNWENNNFVSNTINSTVLPVLNIIEDYTLTPSYNSVFFNGINVAPSTTMTILPGTDVNLNSATWLKIEGNLQAIGTADNHIRFCPNGGCEGLFFQDSRDNILSYVDIKNAGYQSSNDYPFREGKNYTGAVWAINSSLSIDNSIIMDNRRPTGYCINSAGSDLDIRDSELGWSSTYKRYNNWVDGGIKLSGGNLHIENTNFHFLNYAVFSYGATVTYDNMSSANFIDLYPMGSSKHWMPSNLFPF